jgi:hypothetical protein
VLHACHLPTTLGASFTGHDAFIHAADLLAIHRARLTDLGAEPAKAKMKMRVNELKIGRSLADFGATHHQPEVPRFDMLSASLKAVAHGGLQAGLMAMATSFYTGLHGEFSVGWVVHGILLR